MAGTAKKWLIGCGMGCGLLRGAGPGPGGRRLVRACATSTKRAESLEAASDSLATRFGPPEAYVPPVDGRLAPDRLEAFLEVAAPDGARARAHLPAAWPCSTVERQQRAGTIAAGINFVPQMLAFVEERDRALLSAGMGAGRVPVPLYRGLLRPAGEGSRRRTGLPVDGAMRQRRGTTAPSGRASSRGHGERSGDGPGDEPSGKWCAAPAQPRSA